MPQGKYNVLFLSQRNSARSIFAEAVLNRLGRPNFTGYSAGMHPAEEVNSLVRKVLVAARYPTEGLRTKSWQEFAGQDSPSLDFVITLCDLGAGEPPPRLPGTPVTADWRYADPENSTGEAWELQRELGAMLSCLERQLRAFVQLPFRSLDRLSLSARLAELASGTDAKVEPAASERPDMTSTAREPGPLQAKEQA
jgi:arsenate reductase (thioredoxin)